MLRRFEVYRWFGIVGRFLSLHMAIRQSGCQSNRLNLIIDIFSTSRDILLTYQLEQPGANRLPGKDALTM